MTHSPGWWMAWDPCWSAVTSGSSSASPSPACCGSPWWLSSIRNRRGTGHVGHAPSHGFCFVKAAIASWFDIYQIFISHEIPILSVFILPHVFPGGFKHVLFSIIYAIILPIDFHIFLRARSTTNQFLSLLDFPRSIPSISFHHGTDAYSLSVCWRSGGRLYHHAHGAEKHERCTLAMPGRA